MYVAAAQHASEITLRPTSFASLLSSIGGFAKFVQVALGVGAVWWTKRNWDKKPRDLWLMGQYNAHRVQFPKIQLDAEQLDQALKKGEEQAGEKSFKPPDDKDWSEWERNSLLKQEAYSPPDPA